MTSTFEQTMAAFNGDFLLHTTGKKPSPSSSPTSANDEPEWKRIMAQRKAAAGPKKPQSLLVQRAMGIDRSNLPERGRQPSPLKQVDAVPIAALPPPPPPPPRDPSPAPAPASLPRKFPSTCSHWQAHGYCHYGNDCAWQHPPECARRVVQEPQPAVEPRARTPVRTQRRVASTTSAPVLGPQRDRSYSRPRPSLVPTRSTPNVLSQQQLPGQAAVFGASTSANAPVAVPVLPPMFYTTYRRGSNGELLDPALIPHTIQAQKSLYYRTKPCRYWQLDGSCPKGDKCTFIHDPKINSSPMSSPGPATPQQSSTPLPQEPQEKPKRVRLPPVTPTKVREPHPAWRVVGGGVTLANARSDEQDQLDDEEVEQQLLMVEPSPQVSPVYTRPQRISIPTQQQPQAIFAPPPPPQPQTPPVYAAPPFHHHQQYQQPSSPPPMYSSAPVTPVYAHPGHGQFVQVPMHTVYHAYAYPTSVPYQPPVVHHPEMQRRESMQEVLFPMTAVPVLVAQTPSAYVYSVPQDVRTMDTLASAGVDVSHVDPSHNAVFSESVMEEYGMDIDADEEEDDEDVEIEGTVSFGSIAPISPTPTAVDASTSNNGWDFAAKFTSSWADEVEMEDPQYPSTPDQQAVTSSSWDGVRTSPNTPRKAFKLFAAEY